MRKGSRKNSNVTIINVPRFEKPTLNISTAEMNSFSLLEYATRMAKKSGWSDGKLNMFTVEARQGDKEYLIRVLHKYFNVTQGENRYQK